MYQGETEVNDKTYYRAVRQSGKRHFCDRLALTLKLFNNQMVFVLCFDCCSNKNESVVILIKIDFLKITFRQEKLFFTKSNRKT